jgi:predicted transcriptional regulator
MQKANINCNMLKEYMGFLIKQGLVEERTVKKIHTVFAVTQRGITPEAFPRTYARNICLRRNTKSNKDLPRIGLN